MCVPAPPGWVCCARAHDIEEEHNGDDDDNVENVVLKFSYCIGFSFPCEAIDVRHQSTELDEALARQHSTCLPEILMTKIRLC